MQKKETRDGSVTFYNEESQDSYHSTSIGAIEEAFEKYARPAGIKEGMHVLDVCFGLGYNTLAAMSLASRIRVVGIEHDRAIVQKIQEIEVPQEHEELYRRIRQAARDNVYHDEEYTLKLFVGDVTGVLYHLNEHFDAVLFDPFAPSKTPRLWQPDIFSAIAARMQHGARLTTYSCAGWVRENMKEAGLQVYDGPSVGRKAPSTIAVK